ncbi:unnamed protein product, partial [Oppiella nova]
HRSHWHRHQRYHTKPYVCSACGLGFGEIANLKKHMIRHDESLKVRCEWEGCERLFADNTVMRLHMNSHTGETAYRCRWPGCGKAFTIKNTFYQHERAHRGWWCQWPGCDYVCKRKTKLNEHMAEHYGIEILDLFALNGSDCRVNCGSRNAKTIDGSIDDTNHSKNSCIEQTIDGSVGQNTEDLNDRQDSRGSHKTLNETNDNKSCVCIDHSYANPKGFEKRLIYLSEVLPQIGCHRRSGDQKTIETNEEKSDSKTESIELNGEEVVENYVLDVSHGSDDVIIDENEHKIDRQDSSSDKILFIKPNAKKSDLTEKGGKPYVCDYKGCGKRFTQSSSLDQHKYSHSGVSYRCDWEGCHNVYTNPVSLRSHKSLKHRSRELYACDWVGCGQAFKLRSTLNNHRELHTPPTARNYRCDWEDCSKTFKFERYLYTHKQRTHRTTYRCDWDGCQFATGFANGLKNTN